MQLIDIEPIHEWTGAWRTALPASKKGARL